MPRGTQRQLPHRNSFFPPMACRFSVIVRVGVQHDEIKPDHATFAGCSCGHSDPQSHPLHRGSGPLLSRRSQPRGPVITGLTPLVNTASAELLCGLALRKIQCGFASKKPIILLVTRCRRRVLLKSAITLKIRKDFWHVECQRRRNQASVGGTDANSDHLSFPSEHGP